MFYVKQLKLFYRMINCNDFLTSEFLHPKLNNIRGLGTCIKNVILELVINVGSSMVFDYAAQNKPCAYLNYNTEKKKDAKWSIEKIYKYIHFQSMPDKNAVLWINSKNEIADLILEGLLGVNMEDTLDWYTKICGVKPESSSNKIWNAIKELTE
jgi:hypothetical protein